MNSLEDRNSLNESQLWDFTPRGRQTGSVTFADSQYDEAEEILTTRSQKQRGLRPSEFQPVQVGGYAAYYNKDKGVQPRTRIPRKLGDLAPLSFSGANPFHAPHSYLSSFIPLFQMKL